MTKVKQKILLAIKSIRDNDTEAGAKLKVLGAMFDEPNIGHVVPSGKGIVEWLGEQGFYPELNQQDRCDWWTIRATDKGKKI